MTSEGTMFYLLRVLIVDDNPASVSTLKNCFQSCGCLFKVVTSGKAAIQELTSQHKYDLVILDWRMPDMNGGQVLTDIQHMIDRDLSLQIGWAKRQVPVLVFTGYHIKEIKFPECKNFRSVGIWDKLTPYKQLLPRASEILAQLSGSKAA
jgi:CheY-like chemotaxis protein